MKVNAMKSNRILLLFSGNIFNKLSDLNENFTNI